MCWTLFRSRLYIPDTLSNPNFSSLLTSQPSLILTSVLLGESKHTAWYAACGSYRNILQRASTVCRVLGMYECHNFYQITFPWTRPFGVHSFIVHCPSDRPWTLLWRESQNVQLLRFLAARWHINRRDFQVEGNRSILLRCPWSSHYGGCIAEELLKRTEKRHLWTEPIKFHKISYYSGISAETLRNVPSAVFFVLF